MYSDQYVSIQKPQNTIELKSDIRKNINSCGADDRTQQQFESIKFV
jgi:hypothetical protein